MKRIKRRVRSASEWRSLIEEQESSGQAVREFCVAKGLSLNMFYGKRGKLRRAITGFKEVKPVFGRGVAGLVVESAGLLVRVPDISMLREVVAALREPVGC